MIGEIIMREHFIKFIDGNSACINDNDWYKRRIY